MSFKLFVFFLLRTLARDRRTLRWLALQIACQWFSSEFMLDFWQSTPAFCKHTVTDGAVNFRSIFGQFSINFRWLSVRFCARRASSKHFEQDLRKVAARNFHFPGVRPFLGPGRSPKIDQKRARDRKSASEDGAGTDFLRFLAPLSFGVGLGTDCWRV